MRYKVEQRGKDWYVVGLKEEFGDEPDTLLLYRYSYPESETPDVDNPSDVHKMYGALYDLFQCHDGLKKGDVFETKWGEFVCEGIHVVPSFTMPPKPESKRRAEDTWDDI